MRHMIPLLVEVNIALSVAKKINLCRIKHSRNGVKRKCEIKRKCDNEESLPFQYAVVRIS